jgi:hypothetical protein
MAGLAGCPIPSCSSKSYFYICVNTIVKCQESEIALQKGGRGIYWHFVQPDAPEWGAAEAGTVV